jgi:type IV pilus assembly protein PilO
MSRSFSLSSLQFSEGGQWPMPVKGIFWCVIVVALAGLGWTFDWREKVDNIESAKREEDTLKAQYIEKRKLADNLDFYIQQREEIQRVFGALLKQLPDRSEMDALLRDINQAGLGRGLQFDLFKPAAQEVMKDFYAERPVSIKVSGIYHDFGAFASDVAQLPRVVTLNDLVVTTNKDVLTLEAVAKTFRYLDEAELEAQRKAAREKLKGAKK